MVGACADWFAVTALFRRPLGPADPAHRHHPAQQGRGSAQALGGFIADNFLTEAVLQDKLRQLEVARWGGDWLSRAGQRPLAGPAFAECLPEVLAAVPRRARSATSPARPPWRRRAPPRPRRSPAALLGAALERRPAAGDADAGVEIARRLSRRATRRRSASRSPSSRRSGCRNGSTGCWRRRSATA